MMTQAEGAALPAEDRALLDLVRLLSGRGYRFVTPTPATHARVLARDPDRRARSTEEVLGWNLPFDPAALGDEPLVEQLRAGGVLGWQDGWCRSLVRVSSLGERLFLHSAYPTQDKDAVFFGPDSYRFADLIRAELGSTAARRECRIADIGTGAGVGALEAAACCPGGRVIATDVNRSALRLARINALAAGVPVELVEGSGLAGVDGPFDVIAINPPYIMDDGERAYRDGGGMHGGQLSLDLSRAALEALAPGGRLILYTGSAIVGGEDQLEGALGRAAEAQGCTLRYREIDPDVFGEELDKPAYAHVDRIAVVAAVFTRA